ncbi:MAG: hypothetical protein ACI9G1_000459, partial [Pirellulaceae bacterium]
NRRVFFFLICFFRAGFGKKNDLSMRLENLNSRHSPGLPVIDGRTGRH